MAGRFRKRHVEAPDGTRWVVERHWLARRPRYIGFRFGRKRRPQYWEPPMETDRKPAIRKYETPLPNVRYYGDNREVAREERRRKRSWIDAIPGPIDGRWGWGSGGRRARTRSGSGGGIGGFSWGRSSGGGGSSGGGSRGSSGGGRRSFSIGGGRRDGGSKSGDGVGALGYVLIAIAVIAAALFVVFVLIPALIFLAGYLLFWLLVAGWIAYNTLTGRPWVIKATRDGYESPDHAWRITGWRNSQALIDDIADDLRRGEHPTPSEVAVEVELVDS